MTRNDIINKLVKEYNLQRVEAKDIVETFFDSIRQQISKGEVVRLPGFGDFTLRKQNYQRKVRDIPVDEDTPPWQTVYFQPAPILKARVQYAEIAEARLNAIIDEPTS